MRGENLAASRLLAVGREVANKTTGRIPSLPLSHYPRLPPKGYTRLVVLTVDDEMTFFFTAAQRQTSGLTACADPFTQVCKCR